MKCRILNIESKYQDFNEYLMVKAGKYGGMCYDDSNPDEYLKDNNKAKDGFIKTAIIHKQHSIADHSIVNILFENMPKFGALILNSIGMYNTSERSGRFTILNNDRESDNIEHDMYSKWLIKFKTILSNNGIYEDRYILENARYMLDIFNKSSKMVYTISYRNINYLVYKLRFIRNKIKAVYPGYIDNIFLYKVYNTIDNIIENITKLGIINEHLIPLSDNQIYNDNILFFNITKLGIGVYDTDDFKKQSDIFNIFNYLYKYNPSIVSLSQHIRHRRMRYMSDFSSLMDINDNNISKDNIYIPPFVDEDEWFEDISKLISYGYIPQAVRVPTLECGRIFDLVGKFSSRITTESQFEIYKDCVGLLDKLMSIPDLRDIFSYKDVPKRII